MGEIFESRGYILYWGSDAPKFFDTYSMFLIRIPGTHSLSESLYGIVSNGGVANTQGRRTGIFG